METRASELQVAHITAEAFRLEEAVVVAGRLMNKMTTTMRCSSRNAFSISVKGNGALPTAEGHSS